MSAPAPAPSPLSSIPESTTITTAVFKLTEGLPYKIIGSCVFGILGTYYLALGRKNGDAGQMVKGAVLILLSFFLF